MSNFSTEDCECRTSHFSSKDPPVATDRVRRLKPYTLANRLTRWQEPGIAKPRGLEQEKPIFLTEISEKDGRIIDARFGRLPRGGVVAPMNIPALFPHHVSFQLAPLERFHVLTFSRPFFYPLALR
jgi:hypothetical protein